MRVSKGSQPWNKLRPPLHFLMALGQPFQDLVLLVTHVFASQASALGLEQGSFTSKSRV